MPSLLRSVFVVLVISLAGCTQCGEQNGTDDPGPPDQRPEFDGDWAESSGTIDVTWDESTTVITENAVDRLVTHDLESGIFEFAPGTSEVAALQEGDVAVFFGLALRRIDAVEDTGDAIRLQTSFAALPDAIEEGTIEWDQAVDWGSDTTTQVQGLQPADDGLRTRRAALSGDGVKWEGTRDGYKIVAEFKPSSARSRLDVTLDITKKNDMNSRLGLHAEGWISRFRAGGNIDIQGNSVRNFRYRQSGLRGKMKVTFGGIEFGEEEPILKVPLELKIPMRIGVIPVLLKLKAVVRLVTQLQAPDASSQAEIVFEYDGDFGVEIADGSATSTGGLNSHDIDPQNINSAAAGPAAGVGIGIEAPRVELDFFAETLVPYITLDHFFSSVFTFEPPCQEAKAQVKAVIGLTLKLLKVTLAEPSKELWKEEVKLHAGDGCEAE